jgi:hypothetical protein
VELIWFVEMQSRLPNARKMDVSSTNAVIPECGAEDSADSGKGDPAKSELPSNATPSISTHQALRLRHHPDDPELLAEEVRWSGLVACYWLHLDLVYARDPRMVRWN